MKSALTSRQNQIYLATAHGREEQRNLEKPLTRKIETLKNTLVELMEELDTLKVTARKMEAFKSLDAVVGEGEPINMHEMVRRFEIDLICRALEQTGGHQIRAARILGMNVTTLNSMIKRYKVNPLDFAIGVPPKNSAQETEFESGLEEAREATNPSITLQAETISATEDQNANDGDTNETSEAVARWTAP